MKEKKIKRAGHWSGNKRFLHKLNVGLEPTYLSISSLKKNSSITIGFINNV